MFYNFFVQVPFFDFFFSNLSHIFVAYVLKTFQPSYLSKDFVNLYFSLIFYFSFFFNFSFFFSSERNYIGKECCRSFLIITALKFLSIKELVRMQYMADAVILVTLVGLFILVIILFS